MGEVADAMLDGTLCAQCGVYIGDGDPVLGVPTLCGSCGAEGPKNGLAAKRKRRRQRIKARKATRRDQAPYQLDKAGIKFKSHNNAAHLVVEARWDFWPGTELWIERETNRRGHGVINLIKEVKRGRKRVQSQDNGSNPQLSRM